MEAGAGGEVTVGAEINPEGLETTYEIRLECGPDEPVLPCRPIPNSQHTDGRLAAGHEARTVSLTLTGLQPGTYWFGVYASNAAGETFRRSDILDIPPIPPGACPEGCSSNEPYKPEVPQASLEAAQREATRIFMEAEAKRHQAALEHEEQQAKEAAVRNAAEAADLKQREEEEAEEQAAQAADRVVPRCIVPSLKGDTLSTARRVLQKAHCHLGKISQPRRHRGALIVVREIPGHGKKLAGGAAVAVTLGSK
jgi:hypothetical protein